MHKFNQYWKNCMKILLHVVRLLSALQKMNLQIPKLSVADTGPLEEGLTQRINNLEAIRRHHDDIVSIILQPSTSCYNTPNVSLRHLANQSRIHPNYPQDFPVDLQLNITGCQSLSKTVNLLAILMPSSPIPMKIRKTCILQLSIYLNFPQVKTIICKCENYKTKSKGLEDIIIGIIKEKEIENQLFKISSDFQSQGYFANLFKAGQFSNQCLSEQPLSQSEKQKINVRNGEANIWSVLFQRILQLCGHNLGKCLQALFGYPYTLYDIQNTKHFLSLRQDRHFTKPKKYRIYAKMLRGDRYSLLQFDQLQTNQIVQKYSSISLISIIQYQSHRLCLIHYLNHYNVVSLSIPEKMIIYAGMVAQQQNFFFRVCFIKKNHIVSHYTSESQSSKMIELQAGQYEIYCQCSIGETKLEETEEKQKILRYVMYIQGQKLHTADGDVCMECKLKEHYNRYQMNLIEMHQGYEKQTFPVQTNTENIVKVVMHKKSKGKTIIQPSQKEVSLSYKKLGLLGYSRLNIYFHTDITNITIKFKSCVLLDERYQSRIAQVANIEGQNHLYVNSQEKVEIVRDLKGRELQYSLNYD